MLLGSASNLVRLTFSVLVAAVLPPFLVRHLSQAEYSAWVLVLQLSAYVNLLDLGLQTAIAKFVAEYDSTGDSEANHRLVSTSVMALIGAASVGAVAILLMAWRVPELFHQMPAALLPQVKLSFLIIGLSAAFALPFSPFLAVFTGLQEYGFPTVVTTVSRIVSAVLLIVLVSLHGSLVELAVAIAACNVGAAVAQVQGWRRYARTRVPLSFPLFDRKAAAKLTKYGGSMAIWTLGGLFVSGLDILIVGHFDYKSTGFYAIGAGATNFMLLIVASVFGPLLPAISSMQASSAPAHLGGIVVRATRYCSLVLCLLALPLLVGAHPLLRLWVGENYALRSAGFLRVLVLGNVVRQLAYPYSIALIATGRQHLASASAGAEAAVNLALSVWLAHRIGAIGVAIGTLAGAVVSVALHVAVSMRWTRTALAFRRRHFVLQGVLRPMACVVPSVLLYPFWTAAKMWPAQPALLVVWAAATVGIGCFLGLTSGERRRGFETVSKRFGRVSLAK